MAPSSCSKRQRDENVPPPGHAQQQQQHSRLATCTQGVSLGGSLGLQHGDAEGAPPGKLVGAAAQHSMMAPAQRAAFRPPMQQFKVSRHGADI
jgi:hypothetical protein